MKILVYGAGPLGSLFASRLHEAGHAVSLLARGQRLTDLREYGIVLVDTQTGQETVSRPQIVDRLDPQDAYVGQAGEIRIPPSAYVESRFQLGETVVITRGSRRSGGIGIGRSEKLKDSPLQSRFFEQAIVGNNGCVALPPEADIHPDERLLVVRGSGFALGFIQRGPIYEEALKHTDIDIFEVA